MQTTATTTTIATAAVPSLYQSLPELEMPEKVPLLDPKMTNNEESNRTAETVVMTCTTGSSSPHDSASVAEAVTDTASLRPSPSPSNINHRNSNNRISSRPAPTVAQLKLQEKLALITGKSLWLSGDVPRLHVRSIRLADGPHGLRVPTKDLSLQHSYPATCFPTAAALACCWDVKVLQQVGRALRTECLHYDVHVLLGPGMNLKRHPCGGRNFEYFSEDPYLTGKLASAYVMGVQGSGQVAACPKHFCANNQESHRFVVNTVVDERTLRETYLRIFEMVVKDSNPLSMMAAYNKVNGQYCSEHQELNLKILRQEWGFDGVLMSDWGAVNDRVAGIRSQLDLEMPGSHGVHNREIRMALQDNHLTEAELDTCAQRVLTLIDRCVTDDEEQTFGSLSGACTTSQSCSWPVQHDIAKKTALECAVLLQNKDNFLPLNPHDVKSVAVIGQFGHTEPRYQGMGSSHVHAKWVRAAYEEIFRFCDNVAFAPGYDVDDENIETIDNELLQQALQVARAAEIVILCVGLPEIMESEGFDRPHMKMPAQHSALVTEICKINPNVVVVLSNGASIEMPWVEDPKAIFECFLLGEAGGAAIVDIIFGTASPCGKLAETIPIKQEHVLADKYFPGTRHTVEHREGLDVGYRFFDSAKQPVRFPFGHGLTYTTFEYSGLDVDILQDEAQSKLVLVTLHVTNTGDVSAKEIVQCYIHQLDATVYRPFQELKGFEKFFLHPGETKQVKIRLAFDAFSFYDVGVKEWIVELGAFEIRIGASSRDIRLTETIQFTTGQMASEEARASYPPMQYTDDTSLYVVSDEVFFRRFGPNAQPSPDRATSLFHRNTLLKEVAAETYLGKLLLWIVWKGGASELKPGPTYKRDCKILEAAIQNLPLRAMVLFSGGYLSFEFLDAMIASMNGPVTDAMSKFIVAFTPFRKKGCLRS